MTDDLVKRLREWWNYDNGRLFENAVTRIEQLTAERDKWKIAFDESCNAWQQQCEYEMDRAKKAEAERDRYRKALEDIIADCEADYPPSHGAIKYAAKLALKGESHD